MEGSPPTPPAPDLFRALQLEPVTGAPAAVPDEIDDKSTNPVVVVQGSAERDGGADAASPDPVADRPSGLADLLEPGAEASPATSVPWLWIVMVLMLFGALAWVLATQTDLRFGDVIAKREADALATAEAEQKLVVAEAEAARKEYGTVALNSEPDGAQVWLVKPGPAASFPNLPRAHEYLVLVDAPGHVPQIRRIKGSEAAGKLVVDLDPSPDAAREPAFPEAEPPILAPQPDPEDTVSLEVESPDAQARLGLLVGYTPGARVVDLDASETHELWLRKPGFLAHTIVIKGRHWEEAGDELVYSETVTLEPLPAADAVELVLDEPTAGDAPSPEPEPAAPPEQPKKKKKKKKKKKR